MSGGVCPFCGRDRRGKHDSICPAAADHCSPMHRLVAIDPENGAEVERLVRLMEDAAGGRTALDGYPMIDMTQVLREFARHDPPADPGGQDA